MANEKISYSEFAERFAPHLWESLTQAGRDAALEAAWEECAWVANLTEERGLRALLDAMRKAWKETA